MSTPSEEIISIVQAARESGLSKFTLRTQIHLKRIPAVKRPVGRGEMWYIARSDLDSYLLTRTGNMKPLPESYPWGADAPLTADRQVQHAPRPMSVMEIRENLRAESVLNLEMAVAQRKALKITPRDGDTMRGCLSRYRWAAEYLGIRITSYKIGPSFGYPREKEDSLVIKIDFPPV